MIIGLFCAGHIILPPVWVSCRSAWRQKVGFGWERLLLVLLGCGGSLGGHDCHMHATHLLKRRSASSSSSSFPFLAAPWIKFSWCKRADWAVTWVLYNALCNALYVIRGFLCNLLAGHLLNKEPGLIPVSWERAKWRGTHRFAASGLLADWEGVELEGQKSKSMQL